MSQIPTSEHMYCKYMYGSGTHDITKKLFSVFFQVPVFNKKKNLNVAFLLMNETPIPSQHI